METNLFNGRKTLYFNGINNSLGIKAIDSPIGGSVNFTVAFVFSSYKSGIHDSNWYNTVGVVDAEQPGQDNDWGIALATKGHILAGIGKADVTSRSRAHDLCDSMPHAVVVSYDATGGETRIVVDGLETINTVSTHTTPRNSYRIGIGTLDGISSQFFRGNIAEIILLPNNALATDDMQALSTHLCDYYGVHPIPRGNALNPQPTGLGKGDIEINSGATLILPIS